jgi:hypothetical protein
MWQGCRVHGFAFVFQQVFNHKQLPLSSMQIERLQTWLQMLQQLFVHSRALCEPTVLFPWKNKRIQQ